MTTAAGSNNTSATIGSMTQIDRSSTGSSEAQGKSPLFLIKPDNGKFKNLVPNSSKLAFDMKAASGKQIAVNGHKFNIPKFDADAKGILTVNLELRDNGSGTVKFKLAHADGVKEEFVADIDGKGGRRATDLSKADKHSHSGLNKHTVAPGASVDNHRFDDLDHYFNFKIDEKKYKDVTPKNTESSIPDLHVQLGENTDQLDDLKEEAKKLAEEALKNIKSSQPDKADEPLKKLINLRANQDDTEALPHDQKSELETLVNKLLDKEILPNLIKSLSTEKQIAVESGNAEDFEKLQQLDTKFLSGKASELNDTSEDIERRLKSSDTTIGEFEALADLIKTFDDSDIPLLKTKEVGKGLVDRLKNESDDEIKAQLQTLDQLLFEGKAGQRAEREIASEAAVKGLETDNPQELKELQSQLKADGFKPSRAFVSTLKEKIAQREEQLKVGQEDGVLAELNNIDHDFCDNFANRELDRDFIIGAIESGNNKQLSQLSEKLRNGEIKIDSNPKIKQEIKAALQESIKDHLEATGRKKQSTARLLTYLDGHYFNGEAKQGATDTRRHEQNYAAKINKGVSIARSSKESGDLFKLQTAITKDRDFSSSRSNLTKLRDALQSNIERKEAKGTTKGDLVQIRHDLVKLIDTQLEKLK